MSKLFKRMDELYNLSEGEKKKLLKGLNSGAVNNDKLTLDKILLIQAHDRWDHLTKADLNFIIVYLINYIDKLKG